MSDEPPVTGCTPKNAREPDWRATFLGSLASTGVVLIACKAAGVSRMRAYRERKRSAAFAGRWDDALDGSADLLEAGARRQAMGHARPVYHRGAAVGAVEQYSDRLLMFLLKGARPEKYRSGHDLARLIRKRLHTLI